MAGASPNGVPMNVTLYDRRVVGMYRKISFTRPASPGSCGADQTTSPLRVMSTDMCLSEADAEKIEDSEFDKILSEASKDKANRRVAVLLAEGKTDQYNKIRKDYGEVVGTFLMPDGSSNPTMVKKFGGIITNAHVRTHKGSVCRIVQVDNDKYYMPFFINQTAATADQKKLPKLFKDDWKKGNPTDYIQWKLVLTSAVPSVAAPVPSSPLNQASFLKGNANITDAVLAEAAQALGIGPNHVHLPTAHIVHKVDEVARVGQSVATEFKDIPLSAIPTDPEFRRAVAHVLLSSKIQTDAIDNLNYAREAPRTIFEDFGESAYIRAIAAAGFTLKENDPFFDFSAARSVNNHLASTLALLLVLSVLAQKLF